MRFIKVVGFIQQQLFPCGGEVKLYAANNFLIHIDNE